MLNLSTPHTMHTLAAESGTHLSLDGASVGMTNFSLATGAMTLDKGLPEVGGALAACFMPDTVVEKFDMINMYSI